MTLTVYKNPNGTLKDTQINIDENNEFGVSVVNDWFIESSHAAGVEFPHNVSEFKKIGFTEKPSVVIKPPLVGQSALSFECKVTNRIPLINCEGVETGINSQADILRIHISDDTYNNNTGKINYEKFGLVAKLGGVEYARINNVIAVDPNYEELIK